MVRIPARSHVLRSMSNQSLSWWKAIAELVDNSFDAGAYRVVIEVSGRTLTVSDDGKGAADILSLFTVGDHKKQSSTKLGVYGIGAKDAWLSCADVMTVQTVRSGVKTTLSVNYNELIENDWNTKSDPVSEPTNEPSGTKIILPLRPGKNVPSVDAFDELAFAFTPAIQGGKQIIRQMRSNRKPLTAHVMPERNGVVRSNFDIDGKEVAIDIGILPEEVFFRGPLWLIYEHRIIEKSTIGVGQYSARRIAGSITLGKGGWKLSKNKDSLSEDVERLADAIFVRIEHILKEAELLADDIESLKFRHELEEMLNGSIGDANKRESRSKGTRVGSVGPTNSGRSRKRAKKITDNPGSVIAEGSGRRGSGRRTGFVIDYIFDEDSRSIGRFDRNGSRVILNLNHPFISQHKNKNHMAVVTVAASLIADNECRHDKEGKPLLKFRFDDFSSAMAGITASIKVKQEVKDNVKASV